MSPCFSSTESSSDPWMFSKCLEMALGPLRRRGIRVLDYLDNRDSPGWAIHHATSLVSHLSVLGFAVNWVKSAPWPSCQFVYLSIHLDLSLTGVHSSFCRDGPGRWSDPCVILCGVPNSMCGVPVSHVPFYSDACLTGWGGTCLWGSV